MQVAKLSEVETELAEAQRKLSGGRGGESRSEFTAGATATAACF